MGSSEAGLEPTVADARGRRARVIEKPVGPSATLTVIQHARLGRRKASPRVRAIKRDVVKGPTEALAPVPVNTVLLHERDAIEVDAVPEPAKVPGQGRETTMLPVRDT